MAGFAETRSLDSVETLNCPCSKPPVTTALDTSQVFGQEGKGVQACLPPPVCSEPTLRTTLDGTTWCVALNVQVTELCTGGELFDRIIAKTESAEGHYSERDAANIVHKILGCVSDVLQDIAAVG